MFNFETGSICESMSSISLPSMKNLSLGNLSNYDLDNLSVFSIGNLSSHSLDTAPDQSAKMPEVVHPSILTPGAADPGVVFMTANEGQTDPNPRDLRSDEHHRRQSAPLPSRACEDKYVGADSLIAWDPNVEDTPDYDDLPSQQGRSRKQHFSWDPIPAPIQTGPPVPSKDEGYLTGQVNGNGEGSLTRRMYKHDNRASKYYQNAQRRRAQSQQLSIPLAPEPLDPGTVERAQRLEALRNQLTDLAFSKFFIDKIPSRPIWYHIEHPTRSLRNWFKRSERKLVKKMDRDMYAFHNTVKKDPFILERAPELHNDGLRWNVARLMWNIIRQEILQYEGLDSLETLKDRTVRYFEHALWPFLSQHVNPEEMLEAFRGVAHLATQLQWQMKTTQRCWWKYKLPRNREGTIVGDGTERHVRYVSLDGTEVKGDGDRGIYGIIYDPLVKCTQHKGGRHGDGYIEFEVEHPALVADYCPEEQENKSAYYFIAENRD